MFKPTFRIKWIDPEISEYNFICFNIVNNLIKIMAILFYFFNKV